ncbi:hypothetical protein JOB18_026400 [Solea senegalensis]|uniref:Uncharacterized protein n=1 Tax=Solea senegalensis TaxID=28829 RepID=A0AAV6QRC7_SOLSE|nr:hypothetical protein JOB18_026400 [Solea senegalensis]
MLGCCRAVCPIIPLQEQELHSCDKLGCCQVTRRFSNRNETPALKARMNAHHDQRADKADVSKMIDTHSNVHTIIIPEEEIILLSMWCSIDNALHHSVLTSRRCVTSPWECSTVGRNERSSTQSSQRSSCDFSKWEKPTLHHLMTAYIANPVL